MNSTKIFNTVDRAAILDIIFTLTFTTSYRTEKVLKELVKRKEDMGKIFFFQFSWCQDFINEVSLGSVLGFLLFNIFLNDLEMMTIFLI